MVTSPVIVHFVYGEALPLAWFPMVARCVAPTSWPLEMNAVRYTGIEVAAESMRSVCTPLLFHENASRLVSQLLHADVRRAEYPSPPMTVRTKWSVLNTPSL